MNVEAGWLLRNHKYIVSRRRFLETLLKDSEKMMSVDEKDVIDVITYMRRVRQTSAKGVGPGSRTEYAAVNLGELTEDQIESACRQALDDLLPESEMETEKKKAPVKVIVLGVIAALLLIIGAGVGGVVMHIAKLDTIYPNVSILGTDVGGMTLREAEAALKDDGIGQAADTAISLKMPGGRLVLTYADVGVTQTAKEIAQAAYDYGRGGNALANALQYIRSGTIGNDVSDAVISLPAEEYIESLLSAEVDAALAQLGDDVIVDLEAETLSFVKGAARIYLNRQEMLGMLMEAIETHKYGPMNYTPDGTDELVNEIPDIYTKYCVAAQDAVYDKEKDSWEHRDAHEWAKKLFWLE